MRTRNRRAPGAMLLLTWSTLFFVPAAFAQAPALLTTALTLEQALTLAEAKSEAIAGAQAGVRRATSEQDRARSGRLPQLTASASYDRALASEFSGIFDGGTAEPCDSFTLNPTAPLDARVSEIERAIDCGAIGGSFFGSSGGSDDGGTTVALPFGRENTYRITLAFSQSVYSGGRFRALDAITAAGRQTADLAVNAARAQLLFDVTQAYYDAALSDRLVAIAESTVNQADATLRQVQASFDSGAQPEFELLRARVARDNQTPALIRQRVNRETALLRLKQLLELPPQEELRLADSLNDLSLAPSPAFAEALTKVSAVSIESNATLTPEVPIDLRNAVQEVQSVVRLREASVEAARAERRPSASVNSTFSQVAYPSGAFPTGDFRRNWTLGATIQMPLLTGGRLRAEQAIAQADLDQSRAQLEQVEELAALDTRSAWAELVAARASWESSSGTIQQAARAYEIADVRYRAGVSTQLELSDARLLLQQSEANRAQAARDLQVARARIALLPNLPLSAGGATRTTTTPFTLPSTPSAPQQPGTGGSIRNASTQAATSQGGVRQ